MDTSNNTHNSNNNYNTRSAIQNRIHIHRKNTSREERDGQNREKEGVKRAIFGMKGDPITSFRVLGATGLLKVTMPMNQQTTTFPWIHWFLERHPQMFPILRQLFWGYSSSTLFSFYCWRKINKTVHNATYVWDLSV